MRKSLLAIITAAIMSLSFTASADLTTHMQSLAKQFQIVNTTEDSAEFIAALDAMRTDAQAASEILPGSLTENSEEVKNYKQGYNDLIAAIDAAAELAKAGKMAEAKVAAEKIAEVRNTNHKQFR
ncbi:cytochrome b562 [Thorsellia kenyensis]|uniref:Cytochrome b562 n=1 Tax=Thorsellia kenyensis TaxID=1549888 RepID=A0ABV6CFK1_9GAMM